MPYEGEFAGYQPLRRIVESDRVQNLLRRSKVGEATPELNGHGATPQVAPAAGQDLPGFVVAIDGSNAEVPVRNGYPGARVGYCTVASVLINLTEVDRLDEQRPVDPVAFRTTEEAATIDAALPGCNVVTRDHLAAKHAFREALFDTFNDVILDVEDRTPLSDTYEALLALKPTSREQSCPYEAEGCTEHVRTLPGLSRCPCDKGRPLYATDALRIHERFHDWGTNGEAYGEVMQVWERVMLVHLLRCMERRGWLPRLPQLAFFLDGPLAVFGHPAWLSAAISTELKRLGALVRAQSGHELLIIGVEKSGTFVTHFDEIDKTETPGTDLFAPRSFFLPSDTYIKSRIIFSGSPKRYGADTYFGRKVFYKTASGARVVVNIPFLSDEQDTLAGDPALYAQLGTTLALIDKLVSSRYPNALSPIVSAHAQAAIPLHLGAKVLQQLAQALVREASRLPWRASTAPRRRGGRPSARTTRCSPPHSPTMSWPGSPSRASGCSTRSPAVGLPSTPPRSQVGTGWASRSTPWAGCTGRLSSPSLPGRPSRPGSERSSRSSSRKPRARPTCRSSSAGASASGWWRSCSPRGRSSTGATATPTGR